MKICANENCPYYGLRFYSKFCSRCGWQMVEIRQCCKNENLSDSNYCHECGSKKEIRILNAEAMK